MRYIIAAIVLIMVISALNLHEYKAEAICAAPATECDDTRVGVFDPTPNLNNVEPLFFDPITQEDVDLYLHSWHDVTVCYIVSEEPRTFSCFRQSVRLEGND